MTNMDIHTANEETRDAWDHNAQVWDERMGDEGNDFVNTLIWPATQRMLPLESGQHVLDIACGNGLYARKLAALGLHVTAFDFSPAMVEHARRRTADYGDLVDCHVVDATDTDALLALGEGAFDAAICQMALFDMAEISPLLATLPRLLKPDAPFVFSLMHPCFNSPFTTFNAEMEDREGDIVTTYSIKVSGYQTPGMAWGAAIPGQSKPHLYFHRPLQEIFGAFFAAGFVIDALEERAFPPDHPTGRNPLAWSGKYSEIPPVLMARVRCLPALLS